MSGESGPLITLVRHGQTEWSLAGRHTGVTDVPLTPEGENQALALKAPLSDIAFGAVFTSPRRRAILTAELAGVGGIAEVWEDLHEWDYGSYEGITTPEIRTNIPDWTVFDYGAPGGESPAEIGARADEVIARLRATGAHRIAVFAHAHILRVIGVRWIGLPVAAGIHLALSTASISSLGYEHGVPALTCWNDTAHLRDLTSR